MKKLIYILSVLTIGFSSCTEVIDVDIPETTDKLVIEGVVSTETDSSYVLLSKSVGYFSGQQIPAVTNAVVSVNGIVFIHIAGGRYRPLSPFTGQVGSMYNLKIVHEGKEYTSASKIDPLFDIGAVNPVYKPEEGFFEEGYSVNFLYTDRRTPVKYTYFRFGFNNAEDTYGKDSLYSDIVLFDNKSSKLNVPVLFELPGLRLQKNDTAVLIFRSCDQQVYNFYLAASMGRGGGPFSTPPANLPTNIKGDGLGYFAAYEVKRYRVKIQ